MTVDIYSRDKIIVSDTIFALSSGALPAGIAVIRISGSQAGEALRSLAGRIPDPRYATIATLRNTEGEALDRALVFWFPGPRTATGEDLVELHLHGSRAVVAVVCETLRKMPGLRFARPGEFARRAFANGTIDLAEAEGLADLLAAETELQRRSALAMAQGEFSRELDRWRNILLTISAQLEAILDFSDEVDGQELPPSFTWNIELLRREIAEWLLRPRAEKLHEGFRVTIAGPPNAGKSTLFNALVGAEAAITSPFAGTTRDVLIRPVALKGIPFLFYDTAGLRTGVSDSIEKIGIERAHAAVDEADLVLWLGEEGCGPNGSWEISAKSDCADFLRKQAFRHCLSAVTGEGISELIADLVTFAQVAFPKPGEVALNNRQYNALSDAEKILTEAIIISYDLLLTAECLRLARVSIDSLLGRTTTEDMLDALFGRFCIGK